MMQKEKKTLFEACHSMNSVGRIWDIRCFWGEISFVMCYLGLSKVYSKFYNNPGWQHYIRQLPVNDRNIFAVLKSLSLK